MEEIRYGQRTLRKGSGVRSVTVSTQFQPSSSRLDPLPRLDSPQSLRLILLFGFYFPNSELSEGRHHFRSQILTSFMVERDKTKGSLAVSAPRLE